MKRLLLILTLAACGPRSPVGPLQFNEERSASAPSEIRIRPFTGTRTIASPDSIDLRTVIESVRDEGGNEIPFSSFTPGFAMRNIGHAAPALAPEHINWYVRPRRVDADGYPSETFPVIHLTVFLFIGSARASFTLDVF